ncbi:MAG: 16S rRNA (adenine(1518)-N(6)/adenine(1519)-N(6))-dimethyltransferase RsmA [Bacillota bacterium]|nr:16S rRNA (adenine(1518)-N(6)/adenine(1519)-N(6))-dimethyltransferase RsmA [Bacillota bacterium]
MTQIPDVTSPRVLRELLKRHGLQPHKQWGQNFLIDGNIVRKILGLLHTESGDPIIEIGPGAGALTAALACKGANVLAVEIDRGIGAMLGSLLEPFPNVRLLLKDALEINFKDLIAETYPAGAPVKLISNLPYVISGPFMYNLFKEGFPFTCAVLMFQKEVARRLVSGPGDSDYGALSVLSSYFCRGEVLFEVGSNVFWPRPKVGSAVVRLKPKERILGDEEGYFIDMVQGLFRQRRKTILNNMVSYYDLPREKALFLLENASILPGERPERLSVEQFAMLARITYNNHK